jgi:predicted nucleotidyltransferase
VTAPHAALWNQRHEVLRACARAGAHHVRIPRWAVEEVTWRDQDLDLVVDLDEGKTLLDHAALQIELRRILHMRVHVLNARGFRDGTRAWVDRDFVPF